jgi:TonB family protein
LYASSAAWPITIVEERIELLVVEKKAPGGISLAVGISFVLHGLLIAWFLHAYRAAPTAKQVPVARYVEFLKQNPREFTEAPGPKLDKAPMNAPLSDGNRKASAPFPPTGDQPTKRPGDGTGMFNPGSNPLPRTPSTPAVQPSVTQQAPPTTADQAAAADAPKQDSTDPFVYRDEKLSASANKPVNWRAVAGNINEVGKIASLGGGDGVDLGQLAGGDKGTFDQGPLSFESEWYDWGDYAQSMVSKIRVNWYANMPQIIRTGMQGVVTIRFTIHRDGRITDVTILDSSTVPPYDFAARKAIELSSPLNPLPKDFPNPTERVTAMFFYNRRVPER